MRKSILRISVLLPWWHFRNLHFSTSFVLFANWHFKNIIFYPWEPLLLPILLIGLQKNFKLLFSYHFTLLLLSRAILQHSNDVEQLIFKLIKDYFTTTLEYQENGWLCVAGKLYILHRIVINCYINLTAPFFFQIYTFTIQKKCKTCNPLPLTDYLT